MRVGIARVLTAVLVTVVASAVGAARAVPAMAAPADVAVSLPDDGTAKQVSTTDGQQKVIADFTVGAGRHLMLSCEVSANGGSRNMVTIPDPARSGYILGFQGCATGQVLEVQAMPAGGHFTAVVESTNGTPFTATLRLRVVDDLQLSAALDSGLNAWFAPSEDGQDGFVSFDAQAGDRVYARCLNTDPRDWYGFSAHLIDPQHKRIDGADGACDNGELFFSTPTLPTTGTYTIHLDSSPGQHKGGRIQLSRVPADVTAEAPEDGSPVTLTTAAAGQNAKVTFTLTAPERALITCQIVSSGPSWVDARLTGPAGKLSLDHNCSHDTGYILRGPGPWTNWPAGTYTLELDPSDADTASLAVRVYHVPADATAEAVLDGPPVTVATTVPGQNAMVTFAGTAGERVYLTCKAQADGAALEVHAPSGGYVGSAGCSRYGSNFDAQTLTETGTYQVKLDLDDSGADTLALQLMRVPADLTAQLPTDGTPVTLTPAVPGQNATVTFAGTTGQRLTVRLRCAGTTRWVEDTLRDPAGMTTDSDYCWPDEGPHDWTLGPLRQSGTYTLGLNFHGGVGPVQLGVAPVTAAASGRATVRATAGRRRITAS